jgi:hypothetical protein
MSLLLLRTDFVSPPVESGGKANLDSSKGSIHYAVAAIELQLISVSVLGGAKPFVPDGFASARHARQHG